MFFDYRKAYSEYAHLAGAEISYEVTTTLQQLCALRDPKLIIDLGSGWSSFALRMMCPKAIVWSVDTDVGWLRKTLEFCRKHHVQDDGRFVMIDRFEQELHSLEGQADIVLHDMGRTPIRIERLPMALNLVKPGAVIVLDDMHKGVLVGPTMEILQSRPEFTVFDQYGKPLDVSNTPVLDLEDRFAWTAIRSLIP